MQSKTTAVGRIKGVSQDAKQDAPEGEAVTVGIGAEQPVPGPAHLEVAEADEETDEQEEDTGGLAEHGPATTARGPRPSGPMGVARQSDGPVQEPQATTTTPPGPTAAGHNTCAALYTVTSRRGVPQHCRANVHQQSAAMYRSIIVLQHNKEAALP